LGKKDDEKIDLKRIEDKIYRRVMDELENPNHNKFKRAVHKVIDGEPPVTTSVVEAIPVGGVFMAVVATDPHDLLGYGTWSLTCQGKFPVGYSAGDSDFGTLLGTGGAKTVSHSAHAGAAVASHAALSHAGTDVGNHSALSHTNNHSGTAISNHSTLSHAAHSGLAISTHAEAQRNEGEGSLLTYVTDGGHTISSHYATHGDHTISAHSVSSQPDAHGNHSISAHSVTQPNDHAIMTHSVTQPSAHSDHTILPPFEVYYYWRRTA
jgi:hypothetical protein